MNWLLAALMGYSMFKKPPKGKKVSTLTPEQSGLSNELVELLMNELQGGLYRRPVSWFDRKEYPAGFYTPDSPMYPKPPWQGGARTSQTQSALETVLGGKQNV